MILNGNPSNKEKKNSGMVRVGAKHRRGPPLKIVRAFLVTVILAYGS